PTPEQAPQRDLLFARGDERDRPRRGEGLGEGLHQDVTAAAQTVSPSAGRIMHEMPRTAARWAPMVHVVTGSCTMMPREEEPSAWSSPWSPVLPAGGTCA